MGWLAADQGRRRHVQSPLGMALRKFRIWTIIIAMLAVALLTVVLPVTMIRLYIAATEICCSERSSKLPN